MLSEIRCVRALLLECDPHDETRGSEVQMRRLLIAMMVVLGAALTARGQAKISAPRAPEGYRFEVDALGRQEWTTNRFGDLPDENRWRLRLLPRIEFGRGVFSGGVGGDLNYSKDENAKDVPTGGTYPDNYNSRSARLDLAYLRLRPVTWLRLDAGRMVMPVELPEMLWDRDLRPQGGALTLEFAGEGDLTRVSLTALGARGSHVFDDEKATMLLFSGSAVLASGQDSKLLVTGSYLRYFDLNKPDSLDPRLFRQNAFTAAGLTREYRTIDIGARIRNEGSAPADIYFDYCWNTAVDEDNTGMWAGISLGSLLTTRGRFEYTYARVGREATLGAYSTDDFIWGTGWEGHKGELATATSRTSSIHLIGQLQRLRAASDPEEARHWVRRLRIELRFHGAQ
jgi:hypothetical protein